MIVGVWIPKFSVSKMIKKLIYDVKDAYTFMQTQLEITIRSMGLPTASPVLFEMFISGLSAGGIAWVKLIWQEVFEGDADLMNYDKIFGLHFLAGAIAGEGTLCFTAGITGICCASIRAAHVTYFQYVLFKVVSRALVGFTSSVASDVQKVYINGFETKFKQIVGNALQKAAKLGFIGMTSGLLSIAVNKYFEDF